MLILAIETATADVSVALHDGSRTLGMVELSIGSRHAEAVLPAASHLLDQCARRRSEITHLAVDRGPGLFTGLRVGVATARSLALALDVPVVGVGSLEAVAFDAVPPLAVNDPSAVEAVVDIERPASATTVVACILDARRSEVYAALYTAGVSVPKSVLPPFVATPTVASERLSAALSPAMHVMRAGDAAARDVFATLGHVIRCRRPHAGAIADLAALQLAAGDATIDPFELAYLRAPDAEITWDNRHGPAARS